MLLFDRTICRRRLAKQRSCASATAVTPRAHRAFFFDAMRHKVSKKKKRTQTSIDSVEFDLDLTDVTPRLIAMGFPSTGLVARGVHSETNTIPH